MEVNEPNIADQSYGTAIYSAREQWKERQEMERFLHHYTRWEAHGDSDGLERKMGDTVCTRLAPVVKAAAEFDGSPDFNFGGKGVSRLTM
jgi:Mn-dependent DtxR family transcriptional regulator